MVFSRLAVPWPTGCFREFIGYKGVEFMLRMISSARCLLLPDVARSPWTLLACLCGVGWNRADLTGTLVSVTSRLASLLSGVVVLPCLTAGDGVLLVLSSSEE